MRSTTPARFFLATIAMIFSANAPVFGAGSPWGANYFPNVPLITQDGESVRFFDDLIKDKIVSINFIYTTCADTCPLETAQLTRVQQILGDRLGKDVFFYSITIDPEHDTPSVLREYRERFGARWTFLTGKNSDIVTLRRKLGLYVEEIQDGSNNHNVNMIIGNQATGRWMKRSPFENPHVLADQLGNWLSGWKAPQQGDDYANAPKLRSIPRGEQLFRTRCATCHSLAGVEPEGALGPDLVGVTQQREINWLINWLRAPDQMLEKKDPIAMALFAEYNNLAMPNMRLNRQEAMDLIDYIDDESQRIGGRSADNDSVAPVTAAVTSPIDDVVGIMNAWVREAHPAAKTNAGYMTLINVAPEDVTLIKVESETFEKIEMHEMAAVDGLMAMREVTDLLIPANGLAQFEPGGWHLMLRGPRQSLLAGQTVDMTLTFKSGMKQTVSVNVASR
jgi:copper(I)-binding protein/cytochrome oxidase Cu insertion factor (SCO1/SenC/PrrC family)